MVESVRHTTNSPPTSPFLNTAQAAFYIGLSRRTLEEMRGDGRGPRYRRHGRQIRYHIDDLNDWSLSEHHSHDAGEGRS